ncbi:MAG: LPS export ABC transporter periplasmic protein LptC [Candidatus Omnitrophica bacterium]|nr:LPS export ABC transporter periplasmic protein LptC [Candidatus Omnitrophota bacterium]
MTENYLKNKAGFILILLVIIGCAKSPDVADSGDPADKQRLRAEPSGPEPEQALEGYTFNGFSQGTERRWEIKGRSAEIFTDFIQMFKVKAQAFAEDGSVSFTAVAREGKMYMGTNNVRMEKDVVITTPDGARLTTDYLDWDSQTETAVTDAFVVVEKDNLVVEGDGIIGKTDLQEVQVKKNVKVTVYDQSLVPKAVKTGDEEQDKDIQQKEEQRPTIITCDGRLDIYHEKNIAKFYDNVFLDDVGGKVYCDQMDIFIDSNTQAVTKAIAIGNVMIIKGSNISYCQRAVYDLKTKVTSLLPAADPESVSESGSQVKLIIYPDEGGKIAPFGD